MIEIKEGQRFQLRNLVLCQEKTQTIHLIRGLMDFNRHKTKDLHMVLISLNKIKTYDKAPKAVLWRCWEHKLKAFQLHIFK